MARRSCCVAVNVDGAERSGGAGEDEVARCDAGSEGFATVSGFCGLLLS